MAQALHRSAIEGRAHLVAGVRHVVRITMRRFNQPTPGEPKLEQLEMGFDEVVLLANDPDHLERGSIRFDVTGGRQWDVLRPADHRPVRVSAAARQPSRRTVAADSGVWGCLAHC